MAKKNKSKSMNWKEKVLALGIAVILVSFIFTGILMVYENPQYSDFCEDKAIPISIENEDECLNNDGSWESYDTEFRSAVPLEENGWCNIHKVCSGLYDDARDAHARNVFIIALILGTAILIGGIFIEVESVSFGLMIGGLLTIIFGIAQYWDSLVKVGRFIILGLALMALIWIGVKKLK